MEENKDAFERRFSEANALQRERMRWNNDRAIHGMFVRTHAGIHGQIIDKVLCIAFPRGYAYADSPSIQDLSYIWKELVCTLNIIFLLVYTDAVWMPQECREVSRRPIWSL